MHADSRWIVPEHWLIEENYRCALIATDGRLARATGVHCPVTLIT
jgi:hypothetical protein